MTFLLNFLPAIAIIAFLVFVFFQIKKRLPTNRAYRVGLGLALATTYIIFHIEAAVGINGPHSDLTAGLEMLVWAVGVIGALLTWFSPMGMAKTMLSMAVAQCAVVVALAVMGFVPNEAANMLEVIGVNGIFVAGYLASAFAFRESAGSMVPVTHATES